MNCIHDALTLRDELEGVAEYSEPRPLPLGPVAHKLVPERVAAFPARNL